MKRRLRINGVIIFCVFLLVTAFPNIFFRNDKAAHLNAVAKVCGIAFILLGQILRVSGRGYKSEHSQNGEVLIQGGPYAVVRNPMYLGILLIGVGIVLMLFKWWVVCIFLLAFILRYLMLTFKEEKKLSALFSKDYRDYCKRVPRILPSITTIMKTDIVEYLPLKFQWIKKESGAILAVLLLTLFLISWEDIKNAGLNAYIKEAITIIATVILFICLVIYLSRRTATIEKDVSNKSQATS